MITYTSTPDYYNEYISHHGIIGQSWGHRNGPPYPLDSSKSTGSRLKKNKYQKKMEKIDKKNKKKMDKLNDKWEKSHKKIPSEREINKAFKDFEKSHRLFETSDGRSWYVTRDVTKNDHYRYQSHYNKKQNANYLVDTKYNVKLTKTIYDKDDNIVSSKLLKPEKRRK